jgi:hypothetical protein
VHDRWYARISFQGRDIWLGAYDRVEDAIEARIAAEKKYFDPFLELHPCAVKK